MDEKSMDGKMEKPGLAPGFSMCAFVGSYARLKV